MNHRPRPRKYRGFTLVELAVAIFIIALLLGSILVPLATQIEQRQVNETQKTLDEIRDALMGFASANGYLPCPDLQVGASANDGAEDRVAGICSANVGGGRAAGNLPWATLGIANQDVWGNRFRYTVMSAFAQSAPATVFGASTASDLRVCPSAACTGGTELVTDAVAVVISHGKNGLGAISAATNAANMAPVATDELENTDNDRDAVSRIQSNVEATAFDDIVVWLPRYILLNRLYATGRLP